MCTHKTLYSVSQNCWVSVLAVEKKRKCWSSCYNQMGKNRNKQVMYNWFSFNKQRSFPRFSCLKVLYTASDVTVFTFTSTFTEFLMQSEAFISDCHMSKVIFFIASTVKKLVHISLTALFLPSSTYVFNKHSCLVSWECLRYSVWILWMEGS